jgi:hypothetical protein
MKRRLEALVLTCLFGLGGVPTLAQETPAPLTGDQIYLRAVHAMHDLPRPKFATYTLDIDTKNVQSTCDSTGEDAGDFGFDFKMGSHHGHYSIKQNLDRDISSAEDLQTHKVCGNATFAPIMSYNDDALKKKSSSAGNASTISKDGTKIIGRVTAESVRDYIVTIRGHAMVDGHDTYVLKLEPRHSSDDEIFREMHVDSQTFRIRDLRGNIVENESGVHVKVDVGIHCIDAGPYFVINEVSANTALRLVIFPMHVDVDFRAHDFAFPTSLEIATVSK